jgi:hypothetical protein
MSKTKKEEDDEISFLPPSSGDSIATHPNQAEPAEPIDASEAEHGIDMSPVRRAFNFKRATDLLPPPIGNKFKTIQTRSKEARTIVQDITAHAATGCLIASNNQRKTRAAMLLYQGRAVGCIYTTKTMPLTQPTEQAIKLMIRDLDFPNTLVKNYELPLSTILPMSALFLGYPIFRNDDLDATGYLEYISTWLKHRAQTACLAISLPQSASTCLVFIYQGKFSGALYVEDQELISDQKFVLELLRNDEDAYVEASILPPELISAEAVYGFDLLSD